MITVLRLGAFDVALDSSVAPEYPRFEALFRTRLEQMPDHTAADLCLSLAGPDEGPACGLSDALTRTDRGLRTTYASDLIAAELDQSVQPPTLVLAIDRGSPRIVHLDHYLRIVINAVLRHFHRVRMHAAAIDFGGATSLFIGDKGAGKTTISLHLARAGGAVLAEDQVVLRRTPAHAYLAAGSDGLMRLTEKTEAHFFPDRLAVAPIEVAGVAKKEIAAREHIRCEPHVEKPLRRLFFPTFGPTFAIERLAGRDPLARLAAPLLPIHRFTGDADRLQFIAFLTGVVAQTECYKLTVTSDIGDLSELSRFLG